MTLLPVEWIPRTMPRGEFWTLICLPSALVFEFPFRCYARRRGQLAHRAASKPGGKEPDSFIKAKAPVFPLADNEHLRLRRPPD